MLVVVVVVVEDLEALVPVFGERYEYECGVSVLELVVVDNSVHDFLTNYDYGDCDYEYNAYDRVRDDVRGIRILILRKKIQNFHNQSMVLVVVVVLAVVCLV